MEHPVHARLGGRSLLPERSLGARNASDETHLDALEHTLPFQLDYVKPLRNGRVETGMKLQRREIPVDYHVNRGVDTVIYPGLGDWSEWGEDLYAGYVNYVLEQPKYAVEVGFPRRAGGSALRLAAREHLLQPERRLRLLRAAAERAAHLQRQQQRPPRDLLQQPCRSPRRSRAADFSEIR